MKPMRLWHHSMANRVYDPLDRPGICEIASSYSGKPQVIFIHKVVSSHLRQPFAHPVGREQMAGLAHNGLIAETCTGDWRFYVCCRLEFPDDFP